MPKVELIATLYDRLNAIATNTMTVEMLVNRAVDDYLKTRAEGSPKGPNPDFILQSDCVGICEIG
jgi:hypothetical protein